MTRRVKKDGNFYSELSELFEVDTSKCTNGLLIQFHPNCYRSLKCEMASFLLEVWSFVILNVTISGLEKPLLRSLVFILKHVETK